MKTLLHLLSSTNRRMRRLALLVIVLMAGTLSTRAQSCQAWFMYSIDTTVSPNVISMWDSSFVGSGTITNYQWQYNGSPVGTNAPFQTINVGTVISSDFICLTITTDSGCVSTWCDTIVFGGPPCNAQVSYTFTHDSSNNYLFMPSLSGFGLPVTYLWQVSNGATGTTQIFSTNLSPNGFYNVCLTVTDANNCSASFCDTLAVTSPGVCVGCQPQLYYTQDSLNPNLYTFYDTTTYSSTPTSNSWQVNGVSHGSGSTMTVSLSTPGSSNNICRTVSVPGCFSNCTFRCINVHVPQLPGISIGYFNTDSSSSNCTAPQWINFYLQGTLTGYPADSLVGIHVNFDDGTDTSFLTWNQQTYYYTYFTHMYLNPGTYNPQVIVYSPDSMFTDTSIIFTPIDITNTCGPVAGHVYLDNNQNCVFDAGDDPMAHRSVYLSNGSSIYRYASTDANGVYSFNVPTGQTYTIRVDTNGNWNSGNYTAVCPAGGTFTISTVPSSNNNFFLSCPAGYDLSAHLSGWNFVPGRYGSICVYPFDNRCGNPSGQVQMIFDPSLITVLPDSSGHYTISGDTVIWNVTGGAGNGYYQSLCVQVYTATTATIGDSVCVTVILLPIAGDSVPSNNTVNQCWPVRTSWDPNDKAATPEGAGANHGILPQTELTYTIRFQNTGNASAQDIFILDTLDANFDMNSIEFLASSHPMVPTILNGNILRFSFDNINLPDSNENESMSHGYVMYKITPAAGLANGTALHNTAGIYFDYNPAVITNTTLHTIDITLGVHQAEMRNNLMTVYPNPANNMLYVKLVKPGITDLNIYDVTGRTVLHQKMTESGSIDVKFLPAGSYKIQVLRTEGIQNASFMIVR